MNDQRFLKYTEEQDFISDAFLDAGFSHWFSDRGEARSPFPEYVQAQLRENTHRMFLEWAFELSEGEKKEIDDTALREMFENILFNEAMKLVRSDDEKLTITYPFMPRTGDIVQDAKMGESRIKSRTVIKKDKNHFLLVTLECTNGGGEWDTRFELPA